MTNRAEQVAQPEVRAGVSKPRTYYETTQISYDHIWMNKKNLAMHYGFWGEDTKTLHEALINENKAVADALNLKAGDVVLDAGCGVGGTTIWLAENYDVTVSGIAISPKQVARARKHAERRGVADSTSFELRDFCDTGLPDASFDKVYAIESMCYAPDKGDFLREAFRLLKPSGRIIVCDGFLVKEELTPNEVKHYQALCEGWALSGLASVNEFSDSLKRVGFRNIEFTEATAKITRSSAEMYQSSKWIHPLVVLLNRVGLTPKTNVLAEIACQAQFHIFQEGIAVYGIFTAEK